MDFAPWYAASGIPFGWKMDKLWKMGKPSPVTLSLEQTHFSPHQDAHITAQRRNRPSSSFRGVWEGRIGWRVGRSGAGQRVFDATAGVFKLPLKCALGAWGGVRIL